MASVMRWARYNGCDMERNSREMRDLEVNGKVVRISPLMDERVNGDLAQAGHLDFASCARSRAMAKAPCTLSLVFFQSRRTTILLSFTLARPL